MTRGRIGLLGIGTFGHKAIGVIEISIPKCFLSIQNDEINFIENKDIIFIVTDENNFKETKIVSRLAKDKGVLAIIIFPELRDSLRQETKNEIESLFIFGNKNEITFYKNVKMLINTLMNILSENGIINLNFVDIKEFFKNSKICNLYFEEAEGERRAFKVVEKALQQQSILTAKKVIFLLTGAYNVSLSEVSIIAETLIELTNRNIEEILFSLDIDKELHNKIQVVFISI